ncbi:DsbE family thiol:disulfide interchange protein [Moraxella oblonga]|uniref:DsbE family thiol:disulfide interchange protein n=1 Tax=Moraxella oblonga TaxID=200413 RepID=UPI000830D3FA|nr:DsbE family thiol:disulfide interchange protein [Moraxella oblonga]
MNRQQKRMMMFMLPLVVFVLLMIMLFFRLGKPTDVVIDTSVHHPLPTFSLPLLSEPNRLMTNADLPKQAFLLNVWGSWCPTCKIEHPFLLKLQADGVPMVGVNYKDELPNALGYLNDYKNPFLFSVQDLDGKYAIELGLTGAPETFVVDGQGVVYKHILGEIGEQNWANIKTCMMAIDNPTLDEKAKLGACDD